MLRTVAFVSLSALLAVPAEAQTLWTVSPDGTADFDTIQEAIDAAVDGDTILVRYGVYESLSVTGKALTIQGIGEPAPRVDFVAGPAIQVANLASHQSVAIRGFVARSSSKTEAVLVGDCAGPVLFERIESKTSAGDAVRVASSSSVTFVDSLLDAAGAVTGLFFGFTSYAGLDATGSNVFLEDCTVLGSDGLDSIDVGGVVQKAPDHGGVGVRLDGSTLHAAGCTIAGGDGGSDVVPICAPGGDGAVGLELVGASVARVRDSVLTGGVGGEGACFSPDGSDALSQSVEPGSEAISLVGTARTFGASSPVLSGEILEVVLRGEPGDFAILHLGQELAAGVYVESLDVAFHLPLPPLSTLAFGVLPSSGEIEIPFAVPSVPTGHARFVGQAVFVAVDGVFVTAPRTTVMLD